MMRHSLQLITVLQMALSGCAVTTASPPKIEGRIDSVSSSDIQEVIRVVEDDMRHDFWIVYAIERVDVRNHDEIVVVYSRGNYTHSVTVQRIRHGVWAIDKRVEIVVNVPRSNPSLESTAGRCVEPV